MQGILEAILDQFENSILQGSCTGFLFEVSVGGWCQKKITSGWNRPRYIIAAGCGDAAAKEKPQPFLAEVIHGRLLNVKNVLEEQKALVSFL